MERDYCGAPHPTSRTANCVLGAGHGDVAHRNMHGERWTDKDTENTNSEGA